MLQKWFPTSATNYCNGLWPGNIAIRAQVLRFELSAVYHGGRAPEHIFSFFQIENPGRTPDHEQPTAPKFFHFVFISGALYAFGCCARGNRTILLFYEGTFQSVRVLIKY